MTYNVFGGTLSLTQSINHNNWLVSPQTILKQIAIFNPQQLTLGSPRITEHTVVSSLARMDRTYSSNLMLFRYFNLHVSHANPIHVRRIVASFVLELQFYIYIVCQLFGWVIWPVKTVPDITYNVLGGTLNLTQSINQSVCCLELYICISCYLWFKSLAGAVLRWDRGNCPLKPKPCPQVFGYSRGMQ